MVEQYNAIGKSGVVGPQQNVLRPGVADKVEPGQDFKSLLMKSINEVNRLQTEADEATVNLATGESDNVAEVFTAVKKAELAFQTLMQIRNKLMDAYDEVKQMRV